MNMVIFLIMDGDMMDWSVRPNMIFTVASLIILRWMPNKRREYLDAD